MNNQVRMLINYLVKINIIKMENSNQVTRLVSKCSFKDTIDKVFYVITDFEYYTQIMDGFISNINFINGKNLGELGAEYTFLFEKYFYVNMSVTSVVNTSNYKKFTLKPTQSEIPLDFEIIQSFFWDSIEQTTLYLKELLVRNSVAPLTTEGVEKYKAEQLEITRRIKKMLELMTIGYEQEDSITIKANSNTVWEIISNLNSFAKMVPIFADKIESSQDSIKVKNKLFDCEYHIVLSSDNDCSREIVFETIGDFKPSHIMSINMLEICEGISFVSVKHKFSDIVSNKLVNKILDFKKNVLFSLKKILEEKYCLK
jgi:hypothetical protein